MKFKLIKYLIISISIILINMNTAYAVSNQWIYVNNLWYCIDENGQIIVNQWVTYNGNEYHLSENGIMDTSKWIDNIYYVDENGEKLKNTITPDGYYVDENGVYVPYSTQNLQRSNVINTITSQINVNSNITENTNSKDDTNISVSNSSKTKNGFHISQSDIYNVNEYYNDNNYKTKIKIVIPQISIANNWYYDSKSKIEEINDALEEAINVFIEEAENLAEKENIRHYYLTQFNIIDAFFSRVEIKLSGEIQYADKTKKNISYNIKYNIYDKE